MLGGGYSGHNSNHYFETSWHEKCYRESQDIFKNLRSWPKKSQETAAEKRGILILREDILEWVYAAIDEVNAQSAKPTNLAKNPDAQLLAGKSGVDSLTFVNLVVALEEQIQNKTGNSVILVDEASMAMDAHPFRTVGTLAAYVEQVISRSQAGSR